MATLVAGGGGGIKTSEDWAGLDPQTFPSVDTYASVPLTSCMVNVYPMLRYIKRVRTIKQHPASKAPQNTHGHEVGGRIVLLRGPERKQNAVREFCSFCNAAGSGNEGRSAVARQHAPLTTRPESTAGANKIAGGGGSGGGGGGVGGGGGDGGAPVLK